MSIFHSLLLGIIQGLTEFIPVSSTAHLLLGQRLLGLGASEAVFAFLVLVQMGTILALIIYFWKDLWALARAFFARPFSTPLNRQGWFILIATLPALLAGLLLKPLVQALFRAPLIEAAIRLATAAVLMTLAEKLGRRTRALETMTGFDALFVGLMQALAVFPGASRSGTTISGGLLRGFDRPSAARFAFLMSVPVMLAAGVYEAREVIHMPGLSAFLPVLLAGILAAAVFGWLAIRWLLRYLGRHSLTVFAVYCAVLAALCLAWNFLGA
jgi:undecaprenyl-diphosphatase